MSPYRPFVNNERAQVSVRLGFFYIAIITVIGVHLPYWPLWLQAKGFGAEEIGLLLGAGVWMKVFSNPFFTHIADRRGNGRYLLFWLAVSAMVTISLFFYAQSFTAFFIISLVASAFFSALMPLGEHLTMVVCYEKKLDYGRIRLWGSLSFIVTVLGLGWLLTGRTEDLILWSIVGGLGFTALVCLFLPKGEPLSGETREKPLRSLLTDRTFLLFLLAVSLLQMSHSMYYGFSTLHWRAAGMEDSMIGLLWGLGVVAEILLFAFSGRVIAQFDPRALLVIAGSAGILRWIVIGLTVSPVLLALVQVLHGLTFGAVHLAAMYFIARQVSRNCSATAQGLYSSTAMGAALGLGMFLSGLLYAKVTGGGFLVMALFSAAGASAAFFLPGERKKVETA